ncbi:MAG: hypothetical protein AAFX40_06330 [Cyanobacteria bacterium J06639_1]
MSKLSARNRWVSPIAGCLLAAIAAHWGGTLPSRAQSSAPVILFVQPQQTFDDLIDAARREALTQIASQFANDPNLDVARVEVSAKKGSSRAPILKAEVPRSQWQGKTTAIEQYSRVYPESAVLLGFSPSQTATAPTRPTQTVTRSVPSRSIPSSPSSSTQAGTSANNAGERLANRIRVQASVQPRVVPMPPGLQAYRYDTKAGDFFDDIRRNPAGDYTRWTSYPVKIFIQSGHDEWARFVKQGVDEWSKYVPMTYVSNEDAADIQIYRVAPIPGISGAASPDFYTADDGTLQHRVTIVLSLFQSLPEVTTVTRHEIGHALGLWGHTANARDLMYGGNHAEATGNRRLLRVAPISKHAINTLKRVYEQPTLIGQKGE